MTLISHINELVDEIDLLTAYVPNCKTIKWRFKIIKHVEKLAQKARFLEQNGIKQANSEIEFETVVFESKMNHF